MRPPTPSLPDDETDEIDDERRATVAALQQLVEERDDLDEFDLVTALLHYSGVDPDDVVLIRDEDDPTGYRVVEKEDILADRENAAASAGFMSKYLRHECGYSPFTVAGMDLAELTQAFRAETGDGGDRG